MGTLDIIMVIFLVIVLVGGMGGFLYYNFKKED
jgi:flagellar basal body-associated protein FliL